MNLQYPWYRENRAARNRYNGDLFLRPEVPKSSEDSSTGFVPKFEATANIPSVMSFSNLSCLGGHGVLGFRLTDFWQWSGEVGGCQDQNSPTYPYAQHFETTGVALSTGAGVDFRLSRAFERATRRPKLRAYMGPKSER